MANEIIKTSTPKIWYAAKNKNVFASVDTQRLQLVGGGKTSISLQTSGLVSIVGDEIRFGMMPNKISYVGIFEGQDPMTSMVPSTIISPLGQLTVSKTFSPQVYAKQMSQACAMLGGLMSAVS